MKIIEALKVLYADSDETELSGGYVPVIGAVMTFPIGWIPKKCGLLLTNMYIFP